MSELERDDQAEKQPTHALQLTRNDYVTSAKINQRLVDISELRHKLEP